MTAKFRVLLIPFVCIGASLAPGELVSRSAQAQSSACTAYEAPNFRGASWGLPASGRAAKSKGNNRISSFRIVRGCHVVAYAAANFQGPRRRFEGDVATLSETWNNEITSWRCDCGGSTENRPRPQPRPEPRPKLGPPVIID